MNSWCYSQNHQARQKCNRDLYITEDSITTHRDQFVSLDQSLSDEYTLPPESSNVCSRQAAAVQLSPSAIKL